MTPFVFGLFAEYLTILLYKASFYKILHHRKKTFVGEVDIIAKRGKNLVFIEVKARRGNITDNIISKSQQERIRRSAELFLSYNYNYHNYDIRFDLVFVRPYRWPVVIKNAW